MRDKTGNIWDCFLEKNFLEIFGNIPREFPQTFGGILSGVFISNLDKRKDGKKSLEKKSSFL